MFLLYLKRKDEALAGKKEWNIFSPASIYVTSNSQVIYPAIKMKNTLEYISKKYIRSRLKVCLPILCFRRRILIAHLNKPLFAKAYQKVTESKGYQLVFS